MVLLGKYLTSVVWTLSAALVSISLCVLVLGPISAFKLWWVLCMLAVVSCVAHGALYVLIGTVFYRRTMVAAAFYTLFVEWGISFIPAFANQLTVNYRMREMFADRFDWESIGSLTQAMPSNASTPMHFLLLGVYTVLLLGGALWFVKRAEYPTHQDS